MLKKSIKSVLLTIFLYLVLFQTCSAFAVIGYYTSWSSLSPTSIRYNLLTHINYAFAEADNNGKIKSLYQSDTTKLQTLINLAHQNNVKVLISFGGYGYSWFNSVAGSASIRTTFTSNVLDFVNYFDLDGVDIDWEFPSAGTSANNCVLLMHELSDTLHKYNKQVTMAVNTGGSTADAILSEIFNYVDYLNVMAYDGGTPHSPYSLANSGIDYWLGRGLDTAKVVLGVPFYGKNTNGSVAYKDLVSYNASAPYKDQINYAYSYDTSTLYTTDYNGITTIKSKTNLALSKAGGIMIWDIGMDTEDNTSLLKAINSLIPVSLLSVSIEKSNHLNFSIFPNPTSDKLYFNLLDNTKNEPITISIFELSGKRIFSTYSSVSLTEIDLKDLKDGIYIIELKSEDKIGQEKLIIKK